MLSRERDRQMAALLDECIEALLRGDDWREALEGFDDAPDFANYMRVAEMVLEMARHTPRGRPGGRARVWRRIADELEIPGHAARPLPQVMRPGWGGT